MEDIYFELRCVFPKSVAEIIMRDVVRNHEHKIVHIGMEYKCSICRGGSITLLAHWAKWFLPKMYDESEYEKAKRHFESLK